MERSGRRGFFRCMTDLTVHYILSVVSSAVIGTAAVMLALTRIPRKRHWARLSRARWILCATFGILAVSGLFDVSDEDPRLLSSATLCVASFQALLFSYTASVLLSPAAQPFRWPAVMLVPVSAFAAVVLGTKFLVPPAFPYVWAVGVIAYGAQLAVHTHFFRRQVSHTRRKLEHFYDDNVDSHLRPVSWFFYSALGIGVLAGAVSLMPVSNAAYDVFVAVYTLYYVWVAVSLVSYCIDAEFFILPSEREASPDGGGDSAACPSAAPSAALRLALDAWVARREFVRGDMGTDMIAEQLGVTRQQLVAYFKNVHHTTFRSWRLKLRIGYAEQLIREQPGLQLSHLHEMVGFNDRSNFHNEFKRFTGMTPQAYRRQCGA